MASGRTRLFLATGALAALALLTPGCDASSDPTTAASSAADPPATTSTTAQETTTTQTSAPVAVQVAFSSGDGSDCSEATFVPRSIASDADPVAAAFGLLVAGPTTDERAGGASSAFSDATAGSVRSATVDGDVLTVDFKDLRVEMHNASTTCGSEALLAQLNGTAFQFTGVERVSYTIEGSCEAFFNWLQRDCEILSRE